MLVKNSEHKLAKDLLAPGQLKLGDMIQFDVPERPLATHHWAIYVGNGEIIHFTSEGPSVMAKMCQQSSSDECESFCLYVRYGKPQWI